MLAAAVSGEAEGAEGGCRCRADQGGNAGSPGALHACGPRHTPLPHHLKLPGAAAAYSCQPGSTSGRGGAGEEREGLCPNPDGRPGAPPRSAPPPPAPAEGGLSSCLPVGGGGRRAAALPRDLEALACPGPRLLGARERRLFPGSRLLRGRGRPRRFLRSPPRPPSPRRRAAAGRTGHLPCGVGCLPSQAAWPGCALPPRRLRPGRPVPRRSPPTPGKRPPAEGERGKWRRPRPQQLPLLAAPAAPARLRSGAPAARPRAELRASAAGPASPPEGARGRTRSCWDEPLAGAWERLSVNTQPVSRSKECKTAFHVYFKQPKMQFRKHFAKAV